MNVDNFQVKVKKDHVTVTFYYQEKQVAQVNFPKQEVGLQLLQALQASIWGDTSGVVAQ